MQELVNYVLYLISFTAFAGILSHLIIITAGYILWCAFNWIIFVLYFAIDLSNILVDKILIFNFYFTIFVELFIVISALQLIFKDNTLIPVIKLRDLCVNYIKLFKYCCNYLQHLLGNHTKIC